MSTSSPVSIASSSSSAAAGGSVIDVNSLVSQLVDRHPRRAGRQHLEADAGGHDPDFRPRHAEGRLVDIPGLAVHNRYGVRIQCGNGDLVRCHGIHGHGRLGRDSPATTRSPSVSSPRRNSSSPSHSAAAARTPSAPVRCRSPSAAPASTSTSTAPTTRWRNSLRRSTRLPATLAWSPRSSPDRTAPTWYCRLPRPEPPTRSS